MDPESEVLVDMYGRPIPEEDREVVENASAGARLWLWGVLPSEEERQKRLLASRGSGSGGSARVREDPRALNISAQPTSSPLQVSDVSAEVLPPSRVVGGPGACEDCCHEAITLIRLGQQREADLLLASCRCHLTPVSTSDAFLGTPSSAVLHHNTFVASGT